jgi:hypothetical protein
MAVRGDGNLPAGWRRPLARKLALSKKLALARKLASCPVEAGAS